MEKLLNDFKISFIKGDTYALAVKFKNIKDDLGSAYFTVKENADDAPLVQKTLGAGISKIDDRAYKNEKTYKIQLQSEDTANLEPLVQYLYDFRVTIGNVVQTILSGVFVVQHSISNVSTTSTETLTVEIADTLESEVSTTDATKGIEYEQDPVACGKIGELSALETTNKDNVIKAVNEVNGKLTTEIQTRAREISSESKARTDADTALSERLNNIEDGTTTIPNATNATNAENVISKINGTPIDNIFESDGHTAKNAKNCVYAGLIDLEPVSANKEITATGLYAVSGSHTNTSSVTFGYTFLILITDLAQSCFSTSYRVANSGSSDTEYAVKYNATTKKFESCGAKTISVNSYCRVSRYITKPA